MSLPFLQSYLGLSNSLQTAQAVAAPSYTTGIFAGHSGGSLSNVIDYITIATIGNATDFGDITHHSISGGAGVSSSTRGVICGGDAGDNTTFYNNMEYITISTPSNGTSFGNLTVGRSYSAGLNSDTRGVMSGGTIHGAYVNTIDYITIATTANAIDFGDCAAGITGAGGVNSSTRGVTGGGYITGNVLVIEYITIATPSNTTSFGNLTSARHAMGACNSDTRGVFMGGNTVMDYITIATTGNATTFGTISGGVTGAGVNSETRGVMGVSDGMKYITIATTGNTTSFGNLSVSRNPYAGIQNGL